MDAALDKEYRHTIRAAAGSEYLRSLTDKCLARVHALASDRAGLDTQQLIRELHRLAGGTAAVGLPLLAESLRALEREYQGAGGPSRLSELWECCRSSAQACGAALSDEGS